jgi:hypothetical protein
MLFYLIFFIIILYIIFKHKCIEYMTNQNKYICLYAYYEKNLDYKQNLLYFLNNGILDYVDYIIIINGHHTVDIPEKKNIKIIYRENKGYDFGAWSHALSQIKQNYDYYIFINSSVIGPFTPLQSKPFIPLQNNQYHNQIKQDWLQMFLELFNNNNVKLVGTTINMLYRDDTMLSHVQSMFFILNQSGLNFLQSNNFFNEEEINNYNNINQVIDYKEIQMSQLILKNNWNINCIVPHYRNQDYRILKKNINEPSHITDVLYKNSFFGRTLTPEEVIFYKKYRFE